MSAPTAEFCPSYGPGGRGGHMWLKPQLVMNGLQINQCASCLTSRVLLPYGLPAFLEAILLAAKIEQDIACSEGYERARQLYAPMPEELS